MKAKSLIWIVLLAALLVGLISSRSSHHSASSSTPATTSQTTTSSSSAIPQIGTVAVMKQSQWVALSKDAFDKAAAAGAANDSYGLNQLLHSGQFFMLDAGSTLRVLDLNFGGEAAVRVISDPSNTGVANEKVWVDVTWIKPA